jgi:hypothetical protein
MDNPGGPASENIPGDAVSFGTCPASQGFRKDVYININLAREFDIPIGSHSDR